MDYCPNCDRLTELKFNGFCSVWCEVDYDATIDHIVGENTKAPKKKESERLLFPHQ